jgi:hypothetical protein
LVEEVRFVRSKPNHQWDPSTEATYRWVLRVIRERLDHALARRLAASAQDPRVDEVSNRLMSDIGMTAWGDPHPADAWRAVERVAREREPSAIALVSSDDGDDGEIETIGDPDWVAAAWAAHHAVGGYIYPHLLAPEESQMLRARWEAVIGPPPDPLPAD